MIDIQTISTGLKLNNDDIWYSTEIENISYPAQGSDSCFAIEDNSFWFKHRNNCIISTVQSHPPENNDTIFDIGGGNGFVSHGLFNSGFNVALVEPSIAGAINAKKRGIPNIICATTNTAGFKQHSLPAVGLFDVIEHIKDDLTFLQSIRALIKENGNLYITVPSYSFLWSAEDVIAGHFRRYTLKEITKLLELAGFDIEFSSYIFRFLPVPIFLFRTLPYKLGLSKIEQKHKTTSRDHIAKGNLISSILNKILQSEINILDSGKTMPFGGSCLIVAKAR